MHVFGECFVYQRECFSAEFWRKLDGVYSFAALMQFAG